MLNNNMASISKSLNKTEVFFRVEDSGIGFDLEGIKSLSATERGLGSATMEERVMMLDGNFEILSGRGAGTKICFEIPIADSA